MKDREPARTFEDLVVWQKSHALTLAVYKLTATFPNHELYGLVSQMLLANDLGYAKDRERELIDEIGRMLGAYAQSLLSPAS